MDMNWIELEGVIFGWIYVGAISVLALWESIAPRRSLSRSIRFRWTNNTLLYVVAIAFTRAVLPISCVGVAAVATSQDWGLLSHYSVPIWVHIVVAVLVLDITRYAIHRLLHHVPVLWRLHRVHHTDHDFDISTSLRFHPAEMLLQAAINIAVVMSLGIEPVAVLCFECLALWAGFFTHGNIRLAGRIDSLLRTMVITPDIHRVHHSSRAEEYNANYGFLFSWWDRLFRTYVSAPKFGHEGMQIGLSGTEARSYDRIDQMLLDPFLGMPPPSPRETT